MKINEFIEKVNERDGMRAKEVDKRIVIGTPKNVGILFIPEDATNFIEIDTLANRNSQYWKKADREYLSALIEEFIHTPIKDRFPEKKYRLVANPVSFNPSFKEAGMYGIDCATDYAIKYATKYVARIEESMDSFSFVYGKPTIFSEKELKDIEKRYPNIAPAIEYMKEIVTDE